MAFQQPQRHPIPRHSSLAAPAAALQPVLTPQSATREPAVDQSQEWVLFSSSQHARTEDTASTRTPRTHARAEYSEIGSLETAAVSEGDDVVDDGLHVDSARDNDDDDDDDHARDATDTEDLDSLDDGLHEFGQEQRRPPSELVYQDLTQTVLPQHDGLGMFPGSSAAVQEQHWQHEKHNPRRRRLSARRSSIQRRVDALDQVEAPRTADEERTQRIEKWRLDQSRAVLDEIERETHRLRRRNRLSDSGASQASLDPSAVGAARQDSTSGAEQADEPPSESLWERFKRRVIKEFMGIDDATLSYIFGESTPFAGLEEEMNARRPNDLSLARTSAQWEEKLLARIAKELGTLMQQLVEHPGAFSSYLRVQEPPPYAGLVTPRPLTTDLRTGPQHAAAQPPRFSPTLAQQQQQQQQQQSRQHRPQHRRSKTAEMAALREIEEEDDSIEPSLAYQRHTDSQQQLKQEREYWERDLDIKMVFGYLRKRLSPSSAAGPSPSDEQDDQAEPNPAAALVSSTASNYILPPSHVLAPAQSDSLRRAALIRHQHPLINRTTHQHRRASSALSAPLSPILGRRDSSSLIDDGAALSSCASQSTKKSKTAHSGSLGGGSSRNFWDLGAGSVGSGGAAWTAGWGEV